MKTGITTKRYLLFGAVIIQLISGQALGRVVPRHERPKSRSVMNGFLRVHNKPVIGSKIYLLEASTGPYGSSSVSLVAAGAKSLRDSQWQYVTSDGQGFFTIDSHYLCTPNMPVYLYSVGGHIPPAIGDNTFIGLLKIVGLCQRDQQLPDTGLAVRVDEFTTAKAALDFSGYALDARHVTINRPAQ